MKMVKNIAIVAFATSLMFAGMSFNMGNNYTAMDTGTLVNTSWGASFDLNENTSIGYDSWLGMIFAFDAPMGVSLRFGADATSNGTGTVDVPAVAGTSIGLGFTWWSGGEGLKTSISTQYDMCMTTDGSASENNLSVTVGFGF